MHANHHSSTGRARGDRLTRAALVIAQSAFVAAVASGQAIHEDHKLVASDAAAGDEFGRAVAVSGTTAIIGARYDDDHGSNAGSAYLFDVNSGQQLAKLTAADAQANDQFGYAVAIDGVHAIVGSFGDDDTGTDSGAAYIFDAQTGQQRLKLTASDAQPGDQFGYSVAISGNYAIVGARGDDDAGNDSGSAYIFDVVTGIQRFKLTAADADASDYFGWSVALSGNDAVVGAFWDSDIGPRTGSAYVFDVASGQQRFKLLANDAREFSYFGVSVAASGGIAVIGAHTASVGAVDTGAAYLFDAATGQQLHKLSAADAASGDQFGVAVGISGDTAIVGARNDTDGGHASGSAYLFDVSTGQQTVKLTASDAAPGDRFGRPVAICGGVAIAGAHMDDDGGAESGSAYVFGSSVDPCNPADLAEPYGVLDLSDINAFIDAFTSGCE